MRGSDEVNARPSREGKWSERWFTLLSTHASLLRHGYKVIADIALNRQCDTYEHSRGETEDRYHHAVQQSCENCLRSKNAAAKGGIPIVTVCSAFGLSKW